MELPYWVYILLFGAIAGWLANIVMGGKGLGLIGNIIVGVLGAYIGDWLFGILEIQIADGLLGELIQAVSGAIVLLFIVGLVRRR